MVSGNARTGTRNASVPRTCMGPGRDAPAIRGSPHPSTVVVTGGMSAMSIPLISRPHVTSAIMGDRTETYPR